MGILHTHNQSQIGFQELLSISTFYKVSLWVALFIRWSSKGSTRSLIADQPKLSFSYEPYDQLK